MSHQLNERVCDSIVKMEDWLEINHLRSCRPRCHTNSMNVDVLNVNLLKEVYRIACQYCQ